MGSKRTIQTLAEIGIFGALAFLLTFLVPIPYAGGAGYFHFGDTVAILAAMLFNPLVGLGVAYIGSIFADLASGYAVFIPFTILAKGLLILGMAIPFQLLKNHKVLRLFAPFLGGVLMPFGYLPIYLLTYGDYAWMSFGFDMIQGAVSALLAILLYLPLRRALPKAKKEE